MSALTMLSRVSGFIKVAAFAAFYGRSAEADMFLAIMILPDLMYRFLSEGLVASASVPMFVDLRDDHDQLGRSFWTQLWLAFIVGSVIALFLTVFSGPICRFLTPGFAVEDIGRLQLMWSLVSTYIVAGLVAGVMTSLLNARMSFAAPAIGPLLVNISIIAGIFLARGGPVELIALATVAGSVVQAIWLLWLVWRLKIIDFALKKALIIDRAIAREFVVAVTPVAIWISVLPFIPVYERYLLSMQATGSVAALNYAEKLFNLPLGIISISLAHVILPRLSMLDHQRRTSFLLKSFAAATAAIAPVVLLILAFSEEIVSVVYQRGRFSPADAEVAAALFKSYSLALLPVSLCMVLNRGFFAARNYLMPFAAGLSAAAVQFYLGARLVVSFGVPGIGYAAAIAYTVQTAILLLIFVWPAAAVNEMKARPKTEVSA
ncbi:MAG: lipid II flippase MurJ [Candidatus Riflebacteria bacterium]|nr:lipid II flippase MurJ [Candidatus Riflebacteria bacterium]